MQREREKDFCRNNVYHDIRALKRAAILNINLTVLRKYGNVEFLLARAKSAQERARRSNQSV